MEILREYASAFITIGMSGGLMKLVSYGAQDIYLTGTPQITFFKVKYEKHTNFAMEQIVNKPHILTLEDKIAKIDLQFMVDGILDSDNPSYWSAIDKIIKDETVDSVLSQFNIQPDQDVGDDQEDHKFVENVVKYKDLVSEPAGA